MLDVFSPGLNTHGMLFMSKLFMFNPTLSPGQAWSTHVQRITTASTIQMHGFDEVCVGKTKHMDATSVPRQSAKRASQCLPSARLSYPRPHDLQQVVSKLVQLIASHVRLISTKVKSSFLCPVLVYRSGLQAVATSCVHPRAWRSRRPELFRKWTNMFLLSRLSLQGHKSSFENTLLVIMRDNKAIVKLCDGLPEHSKSAGNVVMSQRSFGHRLLSQRGPLFEESASRVGATVPSSMVCSECS